MPGTLSHETLADVVASVRMILKAIKMDREMVGAIESARDKIPTRSGRKPTFGAACRFLIDLGIQVLGEQPDTPPHMPINGTIDYAGARRRLKVLLSETKETIELSRVKDKDFWPILLIALQHPNAALKGMKADLERLLPLPEGYADAANKPESTAAVPSERLKDGRGARKGTSWEARRK